MKAFLLDRQKNIMTMVAFIFAFSIWDLIYYGINEQTLSWASFLATFMSILIFVCAFQTYKNVKELKI